MNSKDLHTEKVFSKQQKMIIWQEIHEYFQQTSSKIMLEHYCVFKNLYGSLGPW